MKNNSHLSRYELIVDGHVAYANYRLMGKNLFIDYVFAPEELRGTGAAGRLMEEIAKDARAKELKITPICSYAAVWLKKHKEFHDLLA
jgi:predicted GNAT family acetyltransferase